MQQKVFRNTPWKQMEELLCAFLFRGAECQIWDNNLEEIKYSKNFTHSLKFETEIHFHIGTLASQLFLNKVITRSVDCCF